MDNKTLYSRLRAAQYVGRNGIELIELNQELYCERDILVLKIIGSTKSYRKEIMNQELACLDEDMYPLIMHEAYLEYSKLLNKEDVK